LTLSELALIEKSREWQFAYSKVIQPYDLEGNRLRAEWLNSVLGDEDDCWIWQGKLDERGYARFYMHGRPLAAFSTFLLLWAYPEYGKLNHGMRFRLCGKPHCVKPGCATTKWPGPPRARTRDWSGPRAAIEAGATYAETARRFGINVNSLRQKAISQGWLSVRSRQPGSRLDRRRQEIAERFAGGEPAYAIARDMGVHSSLVYDALESVGIPRKRRYSSAEVVELARPGETAVELAERLGLTAQTVRKHLKAVRSGTEAL